ncbi:MAG: HAMP domain-containing histidine kinase [Microscillaceae bacterium]|nr:HAMP domain-containing histidine kinase [Microscillaceae bacterium]MDW8460544.1 HAMP domain-containing sensor histidine kinase [Cytophagales bacterium]
MIYLTLKKVTGAILFFFLISQIPVLAQCFKVDSLQRQLLLLPNDTNRVNTLNLLAQEVVQHQQGKAIFYAKQAQSLAKALKFYKGEVQALRNQAYANFLDETQLKQDDALELYEQALEIAKRENILTEIAACHKDLGKYYFELWYQKEENYQKSLDNYLQYLKIVEQLKDKPRITEAYEIVGELYSHLNQDDVAIKYFLKAVEMRKEDADLITPQGSTSSSRLFAKAQQVYELEIENQKVRNYLLIVILLLVTAILVAIVFFYIQNRRTYKILMAKNQEITNQKRDIEAKNEELALQAEEIARQNQQIIQANEQIKQANQRLQEMNENLEQIVIERSIELWKTNKALINSNKELDLLIYRASHDFKGPVSTLTGLTNIGKMVSEGTESKQFFEMIEQTSIKMDKMLEKLHAISYIVGKKIDKKLINFALICQNVKEKLESLAQEKQVTFSYTIDDNIQLYSDAEIIEVILENLVENAIIFRNQDPNVLAYAQVHVSQKTEHTQIIVKDNGEGIHDEHKKHVFDMFFRGSEASRGNGLGLYLVKKALLKLKAKISLKTKVNKYTYFKVKIPNLYS